MVQQKKKRTEWVALLRTFLGQDNIIAKKGRKVADKTKHNMHTVLVSRFL